MKFSHQSDRGQTGLQKMTGACPLATPQNLVAGGPDSVKFVYQAVRWCAHINTLSLASC